MSFKTLNELIKEYGLVDTEFVDADGNRIRWNPFHGHFIDSKGIFVNYRLDNPTWEYVEPTHELVGYINIYGDGSGAFYGDMHSADYYAVGNIRVACVKVKLLYKKGQLDQ